MQRLYESAAYAPQRSYWSETVPAPVWPILDAPIETDVAIIGGGFTGLNAALTLTALGIDMALFEAETPGWGASTRNGGFCCKGGSIVEPKQLARRYGAAEAALWETTQEAAIAHVGNLLDTLAIDADRHSDGETCLAHSRRAYRGFDPATRVPPETLAAQGLSGPWHGTQPSPTGFALNPAKYHAGLAQAAADAGAKLFMQSPVTALQRGANGWTLTVNGQTVRARRVILATNGYSSEDLPDWLRARTLPVQSSVIVTRPLTDVEIDASGWHSDQMAYDSRALLHYFRMLPEKRFLFGMRGGLTAHASEQQAISARIRRDLHRLFPAWANVEITHEWSGLVCFMASGHPFIGAVPDHPGLFASLGFHGNGVAMGSYAGHLLAQKLAGLDPEMPAFLGRAPKRFPLGRHRRLLLRPAYWLAETFDL